MACWALSIRQWCALEEVSVVKQRSLQRGPSPVVFGLQTSPLEKNGETTKILSHLVSWVCSWWDDDCEVWKQAGASSAAPVAFQWRFYRAYKLADGDRLLPEDTQPVVGCGPRCLAAVGPTCSHSVEHPKAQQLSWPGYINTWLLKNLRDFSEGFGV